MFTACEIYFINTFSITNNGVVIINYIRNMHYGIVTVRNKRLLHYCYARLNGECVDCLRVIMQALSATRWVVTTKTVETLTSADGNQPRLFRRARAHTHTATLARLLQYVIKTQQSESRFYVK